MSSSNGASRKAWPKAVPNTSHISFDERDKTFRLYAGKSIYAFCISPELTLEHLHWGESVPAGYDLRYLSQASRLTHFSTVEAVPDKLGGKIVLAAETLEEIQKTWRENKVWAPKEMTDQERFQKRRLENYSWRIMSKILQDSAKYASNPNKLQQDFPHVEKESNILSDKASRIDGYGVNDIPSLSSAMKGGRRPFHRTASEASLSMLTASDNQSQATAPLARIPKPKFIEQLQAKHNEKTRQRTAKQTFDRAIGKLGKSGICVEYSDFGTGDFRSPSFQVIDNFNGSSIAPLRYRKHRIYKGKLPMPDSLPGVRCLNENEASTLVITMSDLISGLDVDLIFVCMHDYDVITRRAVFHNVDQRNNCSYQMMSTGSSSSNRSEDYNCGASKVIVKASSATVDFEAQSIPFYLLQLAGSWGRERYVSESELKQGNLSFGSMRGVSSHQHNPFAAITFGHPHETIGEVRAFSLIYSGDFLVEAEVAELGRLRVNIGIHPMGLQWNLRQGETFSTPEVVLVRSSNGLGGMSRVLHRLYLERLIPSNWSDIEPPILLNTWEAKYFHVNHNNVVEMAEKASKLGINLIVLDDGWFSDRNDDTTSLGDWVIDTTKFPKGLKALVEEVNRLGCKFGLWLEPEMVSEKSSLYNAHRDWYFHVPGRPRQIGRNQMVLDLSRKDVRDYLFNAIASLLRSANIEYIKWDMNRPLTEVYSKAALEQGIWQTEVNHRYVLGVYELQHRILSEFPYILLENCASGGGRFDPGMLYYSPQIWCSDNTDALVRMKIQYGTSLAYPARCIGSHVSTVPNHITGNISRLRTRGFVAMCGTFGFELDLNKASPKDLQTFSKQICLYKKLAPVIRTGDLYRLWNPFKSNLASWMYVTLDKSAAVVFAFSVNQDHWSTIVPRLLLQGLDCEADYEVTEPVPNNVTQSTGNLMVIETEVPMYQLGVERVVLNGKILMTAGLPVKFYTLDDSIMFYLRKIIVDASCQLVPADELDDFSTCSD